MFRKIRIAVLLFILATVAINTLRSSARLAAWDRTVQVAVHAVAADDSPATARYVANLLPEDMEEIHEWLTAEAGRYGLPLPMPVRFTLVRGGARPPAPPATPNMLSAILWSLHLRAWNWWHDDGSRLRPHVRLYLVYHDPVRSPHLAHSIALSKGQIGVVNVFATPLQRQTNNVVIAHELLHIFGATDKYDPATLQPVFPEGYAEPARQPLHPQRWAEIMGGRIPRDGGEAEIPERLSQTRIGPRTAQEIGWGRLSGP